MNNFPIVACVLAGLALALGGLYLLATQKFARSAHGTSVVEIPLFGRLKTNYPSLVAVFVGSGLLVYAVQAGGPAPMMPVTGKITSSSSAPQVAVAIVPSNLKTFANSDGTFEIDVPAEQTSYTGIAYNYKDPPVMLGVLLKDRHGEFNADLRAGP